MKGDIFRDFDGFLRTGWWLAAIFASLVLLVAAIIAVTVPVKRATCHQRGERMGLKADYRFLSGCYVTLPDGRVVPSDSYRVVEPGR